MAVWAACIGVASVIFLYRTQIFSGGRVLYGDVADARIGIALEQHWLNVFRGLEAWNQPLYFFPRPDVLGYNDGYFLIGLLYAGLRALGFDPFSANEAAGAVLRLVGFAGFVALAMEVCGLGVAWAVTGATVFTLSSAAAISAPHIQLLTVGLAPWLAVASYRAYRDAAAGRAWRAGGWSCGAALLVAGWLMTAFYMVWFTLLFGALVLAARGLLGRFRWPPLRTVGANAIRWLPAAAILAAGMLCLVVVYLPKLRENGAHPYDRVLQLLLLPSSLVHVGGDNLLFGWVGRGGAGPATLGFAESMVGLAPLLAVLALAGVVAPWLRPPDAGTLWWRAGGLALCGALALCVQVDGQSLWWFVYTLVPGGKAIRGVSRFLVFLDLPAVLLAIDLCARLQRHVPRAVVVGLAALLAVEEVDTGGLFQLDHVAELSMLTAIPSTPAACRRFFVTAGRTVLDANGYPFEPSLLINVDGMLVSAFRHIPTFNGHASYIPPGFGFAYGNARQYENDSRAAVRAANLESGTCGLDLAANRWIEDAVRLPRITPGETVGVGMGPDSAPFFLAGWSPAEPAGRWTDGPLAALKFMITPAGSQRALHLQLRALGFAGRDGAASPVQLSAGGRVLADWTVPAESSVLTADIPPDLVAPDGMLRLELHILRPTSPYDRGLSADRRELGLFLQSIRFDAGPA